MGWGKKKTPALPGWLSSSSTRTPWEMKERVAEVEMMPKEKDQKVYSFGKTSASNYLYIIYTWKLVFGVFYFYQKILKRIENCKQLWTRTKLQPQEWSQIATKRFYKQTSASWHVHSFCTCFTPGGWFSPNLRLKRLGLCSDSNSASFVEQVAIRFSNEQYAFSEFE